MTDTDSDAEPHSSPNSPVSQTPPRSAKADRFSWTSHNAPTTPRSSPPASPSLGLHSLGMAPFSLHRRQFSSPLAKSSSSPHSSEAESSEHADLVQDSKDVLVQRLNDLAAKLNHEEYLREDNVNGLHAKVDEMEKFLSARDHPARRTPERSRPASLVFQSTRSEVDPFWKSLTPGRIIPSISDAPLSTKKSSSTQTEVRPDASGVGVTEGRAMSPSEASRIVAEANRLNKEMEEVASALRARQEESDHIHDMLITRAERAAQRIIFLERRVRELEREKSEGEMEMLNLQIQLKAIEVQCLDYVPKDVDEELHESIATWKTEWSAMKQRRARRKAGLAGASEDSRTTGTPTRQPRNNMAWPN
ncbi:hypothetical protein M426DRAFT_321009 [Hypoxylon sp. CI-4A]|nr:hypothetical protein M426DRAFT_321009 [Hypoxylon sp. CI-4A]